MEQNSSPVVSSAGGLTNPAYQSVEASMDPQTKSLEWMDSDMMPMMPVSPANLGFAMTVNLDSAQVASKKGTIMRPNPQSTTAW